MKSFKQRIGGKEYSGFAERIGQTVWMHLNGEIYTIEVKRDDADALAGADDEGVAPMPGLISKILVEEGQKVEAGQAVIVMEAMKMEYTVEAPSAGTVKLLCKAGDSVALGTVLFEAE